jgi:hypothetical protein
MAAKLEGTKTLGSSSVAGATSFSYRVDGKQKWETARTLDEARKAKSARVKEVGCRELSRLEDHATRLRPEVGRPPRLRVSRKDPS